MTVRGNLRPVIAGLCMATIMGFSFLFTKTALARLGPLDLLGLRFGLAALAMTALIGLGRAQVNLQPRRWLCLLPLAAVQPVAYFLCETYGIKLASASEAGMIVGFLPVAATILAAIFLRERPSAVQTVFILLCSLGVVVMVASGGGPGGSHLGGLFLLLGAVLAAGIYIVLSRHFSRTFRPAEITMVMMWTGALVFNALALGRHGLAGTFASYRALTEPAVWVSLIYLGLLSSVTAFFLVNYVLGKLEAARAAVYTNLTSLISVLAGVLILGEAFSWPQGIGGLLIVLGVWGANRSGWTRRKEQAQSIAAGWVGPGQEFARPRRRR